MREEGELDTAEREGRRRDRRRGGGGRVTGYERELGWKNRGINGDGGMRRERERERRRERERGTD